MPQIPEILSLGAAGLSTGAGTMPGAAAQGRGSAGPLLQLLGCSGRKPSGSGQRTEHGNTYRVIRLFSADGNCAHKTSGGDAPSCPEAHSKGQSVRAPR